jgi:hypothetical protein
MIGQRAKGKHRGKEERGKEESGEGRTKVTHLTAESASMFSARNVCLSLCVHALQMQNLF